MTTRLQETTELRVGDEAGALAGLIEHERRCREMAERLAARERSLELLGETKHRATICLLAIVCRDVGLQEFEEPAPGQVFVRGMVRVRGRRSNMPLTAPFGHLWELRDGRAVSVEAHLNPEEARPATG